MGLFFGSMDHPKLKSPPGSTSQIGVEHQNATEKMINSENMAVCQNLVPLVNIKIAGKWMFIPLKMVLIGIDPYPYDQYILRWCAMSFP